MITKLELEKINEIKCNLSKTKIDIKNNNVETQRILFSLGFHWISDDIFINNTFITNPDAYFILIESPYTMTYVNENTFNNSNYKEIDDMNNILSLPDKFELIRPFENKDECMEEIGKHSHIGMVKLGGLGSDYYYSILSITDTGVKTILDFYEFCKLDICNLRFIDGQQFGIKL